MRRLVRFLDKMDVVRCQFAGRITAEQRVKDFQYGVVQFVLQDADQVAFDGLAGFSDAVHFQLDAILFPHQILLRLVVLTPVQRHAAQTHQIAVLFTERPTPPLQIDAVLIHITFTNFKFCLKKNVKSITSVLFNHLVR